MSNPDTFGNTDLSLLDVGQPGCILHSIYSTLKILIVSLPSKYAYAKGIKCCVALVHSLWTRTEKNSYMHSSNFQLNYKAVSDFC